MSGLAKTKSVSLAGRLPHVVSSSRMLNVARLQAQRDLRHGLKRLGEYLRDPKVPIDDLYLKAIATIADRVGLPRVSAQTVAMRSANLTATANLDDTELKTLLVAAISGPLEGGDD